MVELTNPNEDFKPEEMRVISDLETLRVLSDALRLQIVETTVDEARTVKQIAKMLGTSTTKLYYHVNQLEEADILKVVATRIVSGVIEKQYRATAKAFTVNKSLLSLLKEAGDDTYEELISKIFDASRQDVVRALNSGLINLTDNANQDGHPMVLMRSLNRMSKEQGREFARKIEALLKEFSDCCPPDQPGQSYGFTVAMYPMVQDPDNLDDEAAGK
jgi:DNA-binding Lrp family transcriptional regulator